MRHYRVVFTLAAVLACASSVLASEEEFLPWKQVKIVCADRPETGTVVFEAQTDGDAYKAVSISVFGKPFKVEGPQLAKLKGFPLSSLSITHEAGYKELGGHTVHFKMKQVRYQSNKLLEDRILISISKGKGLEIHGPETTELKVPK